MTEYLHNQLSLLHVYVLVPPPECEGAAPVDGQEGGRKRQRKTEPQGQQERGGVKGRKNKTTRRRNKVLQKTKAAQSENESPPSKDLSDPCRGLQLNIGFLASNQE